MTLTGAVVIGCILAPATSGQAPLAISGRSSFRIPQCFALGRSAIHCSRRGTEIPDRFALRRFRQSSPPRKRERTSCAFPAFSREKASLAARCARLHSARPSLAALHSASRPRHQEPLTHHSSTSPPEERCARPLYKDSPSAIRLPGRSRLGFPVPCTGRSSTGLSSSPSRIPDCSRSQDILRSSPSPPLLVSPFRFAEYGFTARPREPDSFPL